VNAPGVIVEQGLGPIRFYNPTPLYPRLDCGTILNPISAAPSTLIWSPRAQDSPTLWPEQFRFDGAPALREP